MDFLFIDYLIRDPLFFVSVVVTVIVSIVLHELSHGWAAIWQGRIITTRRRPGPRIRFLQEDFLCAKRPGNFSVA